MTLLSDEIETVDDHEEIQLSAASLEALASFLSEKEEKIKRFEALKLKIDQQHAHFAAGDVGCIVTMKDFEEDWQHSQFWYSDETATVLAEELLEGATEETAIAIVSAPSIFVKIRELQSIGKIPKNLNIQLLEFDERFKVFGEDFTLYDFQKPLQLPPEFKGKFDRIFLDPPFLSNDCQTKSALTVRWMTKPWLVSPGGKAGSDAAKDPGRVRIIVCTGERMRGLLEKLYRGVGLRATSFDVQHDRGLSNEFLVYSSFESARIQHGERLE